MWHVFKQKGLPGYLTRTPVRALILFALSAPTMQTVAEAIGHERALAPPVSGYVYMTEQEQQLQDDTFANPGLLWVDQGQRLFGESPSADQAACSSCHQPDTLTSVAARYPQYDETLKRVINLEQRINQCRMRHQQQAVLPYESEALLSLTAYVANLARGEPITPKIDQPAAEAFERGRAYYYTRRGQLNLACHHCHELNPGKWLRGDRLSQGQATGYPAYKLDWQTIGSSHRRLRDCDIGVRAQPLSFGDQQYVDLELFLAWRAASLPIETPAIRR